MNGSVDLTDIAILEFDWNSGNKEKNYIKHKVTVDESEEVFYNQYLSIFQDLQHSKHEKRFTAYGSTDRGRKLTVVFTIRGRKLRVISARDQSKKERRMYEKN